MESYCKNSGKYALNSLNFILLILILGMCHSCDFIFPKEESWVAKYQEHTLTTYQLRQHIPEGLTTEDSAKIAQEYIDQWLQTKIMLQHAGDTLSKQKLLEIEDKVENYRQDLISENLENLWLKSNHLDSIADSDLVAYFEENNSNFVSDRDWVSYRYIAVPTDSLKKVKKWFANAEFTDSLKNWTNKHGFTHQLDSAVWLDFESLKQQIPLPTISNNKGFLQRTKQINIQENGYTHLVEFTDYATKGGPLPYTIAKPTIKNLLLNKRKLHLLAEEKKKLYQNALQNDEIQFNKP